MNWKRDKELRKLLSADEEDSEICCKFFEMYYKDYSKIHVKGTGENHSIICNGKNSYDEQESNLVFRFCAYLIAQTQITFFLNKQYLLDSMTDIKENSLIGIYTVFLMLKTTAGFSGNRCLSLKTDIKPKCRFETANECDRAADNLVELFLCGNCLDFDEIFSILKAIYNFIDNTIVKFDYYEKGAK